METSKEMLLKEAKRQSVLRISGTDGRGRASITTPERALRVLEMYGAIVQRSRFPEKLFSMLK